MIYNDEEKQYKQAIDILKQLPPVNAPLNFEADLMRRINSGNFEEKHKERFWDILMSPLRLASSAALAVLAVIMFFMIDTSTVEQKDPLIPEARLREDAGITGASDISFDEELNSIKGDKTSSAITRGNNTPGFTTASNITKAGLNFRQIQLTEEEKEVLNKLKAKIQQYMQQSEKNAK